MISAVIYSISTIIVSLFCYKTYSVGYGKKEKNVFANYLFWSSLFITIAFLKSAILIPIADISANNEILFWADFSGRFLFYTAGAFAIQIPLYKFFPNNKKNMYGFYLWVLVGVVFLIYQLFDRNVPVIESTGIVNWGAKTSLTVGMAFLIMIPWAVTSFIFIKEFIKSKFTKIRSFLLGSGWFFVCVGATFQDSSRAIAPYVFFSILLMFGFMLVLAGLYYEE